MIYDHIKYIENIDHETGNIKIRAIYTVEFDTIIIDPETDEETKTAIKIELAKAIQKEMIKNLSGFFHDSFNEEGIAYIATMNHEMLDYMRKLGERTKWMKIEDIEKIFCAYTALKELGTFHQEG